MPFAIVRHAHAGDRWAWNGDDRARPLSERGRSQARTIAQHLTERAPARLLSSPATRCVQTLAPLADALGLPVETDERLFEGPREPWLADLIAQECDDNTVVCTHGDVIPVLLQLIIDDGLPAPATMAWHKGSVWTLERRHGHWDGAAYWRPDA